MNKTRGFTLIELLVVIAIIGILASVVVASLNSARAKSRDANRMQAVQQIHNAIELYVNEHGRAPDAGDEACLEINSGNQDCVIHDYDERWNELAKQLAPHIATLSNDPLSSKGENGYGYVYVAPGGLTDGADSISYKIYASKLETSEKVYGFGVGFAAESSDEEKCPYEDDKACAQWQEEQDKKREENKGEVSEDEIKKARESCEKGDERSCEWLKERGY